MLLGEREWKNNDFETTASRTCCEIMRDRWLSDKDFDDIRGMNEFQNIVAML